MKYCAKCGKDLMDDAVVCPACGCSQDSKPATAAATPVQDDSNSFGWGFLGFCVPIAGLILFLIWKDSAPKKAKSAGIGALISFIASIVFYIVYVLIIAVAIGSSGYYYY